MFLEAGAISKKHNYCQVSLISLFSKIHLVCNRYTDNRAALGFTLQSYPDNFINLLLGRDPMWAYKILHSQNTALDDVEESTFSRVHSTSHNPNNVQGVCFSGTLNLSQNYRKQKAGCLLLLLQLINKLNTWLRIYRLFHCFHLCVFKTFLAMQHIVV